VLSAYGRDSRGRKVRAVQKKKGGEEGSKTWTGRGGEEGKRNTRNNGPKKKTLIY